MNKKTDSCFPLIKKEQDFYKEVLDNMAEIVMFLTVEGKIIFVNKQFLKISGHSFEDVQGKHFLEIDFLQKKDILSVRQRFLSVLRENLVDTRELRVKTKNGAVLWAESSIKKIELNGEDILVIIARNITCRKKNERKLIEKSKFLETLLDAIPIPVFYEDNDCNFLGVNKSFEDFVGKDRKEIIGKKIYNICPKQTADNHFKKSNKLLRDCGCQVYEGIIGSKNKRNVVFYKNCFTDTEDKVSGLIGVVIDEMEKEKFLKSKKSCC